MVYVLRGRNYRVGIITFQGCFIGICDIFRQLFHVALLQSWQRQIMSMINVDNKVVQNMEGIINNMI